MNRAVACTNCRKPITGRYHDHSRAVTVNGSVMKQRISRVINCDAANCKSKRTWTHRGSETGQITLGFFQW